MDNENKAKSLSYYHCTRGTCNGKECEGCEYAKADDAVLAMADWKDEQFAAERQALIDKACEWLKKMLHDGINDSDWDGSHPTDIEATEHWTVEEFIDDFLKAMEDTK